MKHNIISIFLLTLIAINAKADDFNYYVNSFNTENGLTQNDITSITQDCTGFIWMATNNGLNRLDGYRTTTFKHSLDSMKNSIYSNLITSITADSANCIWIANRKEGIDCYDTETNSFNHFLAYHDNDKTIPLDNVNKIYYSPQNRLYACTQNCLIVYDHVARQFVKHEACNLLPETGIQIMDVCSNKSGNTIFIATSKGVFQYKIVTHKLTTISAAPSKIVHFNRKTNTLYYSDTKGLVKKNWKQKKTLLMYGQKPLNDITTLLTDSKGSTWIGTKNGLYIEKRGGKVMPFDVSPNYHVLSLYEDNTETIWVGSRTYGAKCISPQPTKFRLYNSFTNNGFTPATFAIYPENEDSLWIGTKQGELHLIDRKKKKVVVTAHMPTGGINSISRHISNNFLWLAGAKGLYVFDKRTHRISCTGEPEKTGSIASLFLEEDSTLWCASRNGLFSYKNNKMEKIYPLGNNSDENLNICRTIFVKKDTIWAGFASRGLVKIIRRKGKFQCFPNEYNCIKEKDISFVRRDSSGDLLVGTWGGGAYILHEGKWTYLTEENGLADNIVFSIYEDKQKDLWISTYNGLSHFNAKTRFMTKYDTRDGLPSNEFSVGAHFMSKENELFLGTVNGIISFFPYDLEKIDIGADIILTDLYLFDKKINVNESVNGNIILNKPLYDTKDVTLSHNMNSFSFNLTNFNYSSKIRPSVRYKLNGWETQWNALPSDLTIKYTNIPPGKYQLSIYKQFPNGDWSEKVLLSLRINPPFYASSLAFATYGIIFIFVAIGFAVRFKRRNRLKRLLFEEMKQKKYQEQLYLTRMKFYTNVSHELRTPLTLILGMLERIKAEVGKQETIIKQLDIAKRNAEKLHLLINDILDLRKIENKSMEVKKEYRNIVSFLETIISYFNEIAETKHINIEFSHNQEVLICPFDVDKTEKIMYNLLSNAMKYTTSHISIILNVLYEKDSQTVEITVKDNGKGIPEKEQGKIFSRYYQAENSTKTDSSGIGLNLALEMARLQNGDISLSSTAGEGTSFTFKLPIETEKAIVNIEILENNNKPLILLVDDSEDMLYYMQQVLGNAYMIYTATNGHQAIEIANKIIPDIIICDIMMPDISGIDVCRELKSTPLTCHISIILVSARGKEQIWIDGLTLGADIYIPKPFSEDYLKAQIKSLLVNRSLLKKQIRNELMQLESQEDKEPKKAKYQDEILQKIIYYVEQNLSCEDYDLERLSSDMCMSQMSLYRKIKTCTDQSPGEFIRNYKLKKAAELLTNGDEYISNVCFRVGFNDLKSFRVAFKKKYGITPSEFKKRMEENRAN